MPRGKLRASGHEASKPFRAGSTDRLEGLAATKSISSLRPVGGEIFLLRPLSENAGRLIILDR
jgi:hypothetical protein